MVSDPTELKGGLLAAMLADTAAPPCTVADVAAAARIKRRVLARVEPKPLATLHQPGWRPWVDKTERKTLFDDGVSRSWLVHMRPGAVLPPHSHDDGDEECVVLQGEVWVDGRRLRAGDYSVALRGSRHESVCTVTGAVIFLRSPSPLRPASQAV